MVPGDLPRWGGLLFQVMITEPSSWRREINWKRQVDLVAVPPYPFDQDTSNLFYQLVFATVLRDTPSRSAIARPDNSSTRLSRRISAQSSTVITIHLHQVAHYSVGRNGSLFTQHRQPATGCATITWSTCPQPEPTTCPMTTTSAPNWPACVGLPSIGTNAT